VAAGMCAWSAPITRSWWSELSVAPWGLMAMFVMHGFAVKLGTMFRWTLAARWHGPFVALTIVETMIDVSVEMTRPVIPRSRSDEYTARKPLRPIITVRGTVIRRYFVISVRTDRRLSNANRNLRLRTITVSQSNANTNSQ
jgi:hypothetical protein